MGYASGVSCHTDAIDAAVEACSRLTFGYSGGVANCEGATVLADVATLVMQYTPTGGSGATSNVVMQLQPCSEVTTEDALEIGWGVLLIAVMLGALAMMRRAAR
jgi:hypothetical protein